MSILIWWQFANLLHPDHFLVLYSCAGGSGAEIHVLNQGLPAGKKKKQKRVAAASRDNLTLDKICPQCSTGNKSVQRQCKGTSAGVRCKHDFSAAKAAEVEEVPEIEEAFPKPRDFHNIEPTINALAKQVCENSQRNLASPTMPYPLASFSMRQVPTYVGLDVMPLCYCH